MTSKLLNTRKLGFVSWPEAFWKPCSILPKQNDQVRIAWIENLSQTQKTFHTSYREGSGQTIATILSLLSRLQVLPLSFPPRPLLFFRPLRNATTLGDGQRPQLLSSLPATLGPSARKDPRDVWQ